MARSFACPHLGAAVELTDEREQHIRERHEVAVTRDGYFMAATLSDPDSVRIRRDSLGFVRRFDDLIDGHWLVVVVLQGVDRSNPAKLRPWIVTAWAARRPPPWSVIWTRS